MIVKLLCTQAKWFALHVFCELSSLPVCFLQAYTYSDCTSHENNLVVCSKKRVHLVRVWTRSLSYTPSKSSKLNMALFKLNNTKNLVQFNLPGESLQSKNVSQVENMFSVCVLSGIKLCVTKSQGVLNFNWYESDFCLHHYADHVPPFIY